MKGAVTVTTILVGLTGIAGWLAYRPHSVEARELTPAAAYWMHRARAAEDRAARLAGVLAEARAAAKARRVVHAPSPVAAIRLVFGPAADRAIRVAYCETAGTLSATAANPTDRHSDGSLGSWGLFQIGSVHREPGESVAAFRARMFNPLANARMAYRLSDGGRSFSAAWRTCGAGL
jgi:hypothetical protein